MWNIKIKSTECSSGNHQYVCKFCNQSSDLSKQAPIENGNLHPFNSDKKLNILSATRCRWSWGDSCHPEMDYGADKSANTCPKHICNVSSTDSNLFRTLSLPRVHYDKLNKPSGRMRCPHFILYFGNRNTCYFCHQQMSLHDQKETVPKMHSDLPKYRGVNKTNGNLSNTVSSDKPRVCHLNPSELKRRLDLMKMWFNEFDDMQKNVAIKAFLEHCGSAQNHLLSVLLQDGLHRLCPPNCQDIVSWLPTNITFHIFSYLDPVSLSKCLRVCQTWNVIASEPKLWQRFCKFPEWQLSPNGQAKQNEQFRNSQGTIEWKKAFVERYRLKRNWLKGYCHVRTFEGHSQCVTCVQFDETRIVSGSSDKTIKVWNIRTNSPWSVMTLVGHSGTVRCLHLEGNRLVSGSTDCTIKVWDLSSEVGWSSIACKVTMVGHLDIVRCLQVDDEKVVSGSYDHTLKVWDIHTGLCHHTLRGHEGAVLCVQFDELKLISGSCDKTIKIWELDSGRCVETLEGHKDAVTCLQFDQWRIISGSLDRTIKFWNLASGDCLSTLDWMKSEGHTGVIRCLQADRWRIVSGGDDKTLKVWSLETGQRLVTLKNHSDGVTCLQFNDSVIVSGSYDKTVRLWDFSVC